MADHLSVFNLKYAKNEKVFYCLNRCETFSVGRPILDSFKKVMTSYKESNKHDLD